MKYKPTADHTLYNLVLEFEESFEKGEETLLDEKSFLSLISYYRRELFIDKALEVVEYALSKFVSSTTLHIQRAELLLSLKKFDRALTVLDEAQMMCPKHLDIQLLKARAWASNEDHSSALALINELKFEYAEGVDLSHISYSEACVHESMKDFDSAYESLRSALYHNPVNIKALEKIWVCAELTRRFDESIDIHNEILDAQPYNHLAWYNLGQAYSCVGQYKEAIDAYELSFVVDENFEAAYIECAELCCEVSDHAKALKIYLEALSVFGPDCDMYANIGYCYLKLGEYKKAKKYFDRSLALDPYNDQVLFYRGLCLYSGSNWSKALKAFSAALDLENRKEEYLLYIAKTYWKLGDAVKADYFFSKATEIGPEQSYIWKEHCIFLYQTDQTDQALDVLEEGVIHAMDPELLFLKSSILFSSKRHAESYEVLKEALLECSTGHDALYSIAPEMRFDKVTQDMINYYSKEEKEALY